MDNDYDEYMHQVVYAMTEFKTSYWWKKDDALTVVCGMVVCGCAWATINPLLPSKKGNNILSTFGKSVFDKIVEDLGNFPQFNSSEWPTTFHLVA